MKLVSYAIWGNNAKYVAGAIANARLCGEFYPDWIPRFYCSQNVSDALINKLALLGAEVIMRPACEDYRGLYWRLEPGYDTTFDRVIFRDCDSRPNKREATAVRDWEATKYPVHIMRDHAKFHGAYIMGGMFGMVPGSIPDYQTNLRRWVESIQPNHAPLGEYWGLDQEFLRLHVWPHIRDNHLAHDDSRHRTRTERRFRVKLPKGMFVGQRFDENNQPEYV